MKKKKAGSASVSSPVHTSASDSNGANPLTKSRLLVEVIQSLKKSGPRIPSQGSARNGTSHDSWLVNASLEPETVSLGNDVEAKFLNHLVSHKVSSESGAAATVAGLGQMKERQSTLFIPEDTEGSSGVTQKSGSHMAEAVTTWIQCDRPTCGKWRRIATEIAAGIGDEDKWCDIMTYGNIN